MKLPENRAQFSIKEMTEICGISRASLLRLEEDGFLTPYRVNPETGYRYYDLQNVAAVGQYQRMQTIGLSRKEIADLYYERVDSAAFLAELRQKLARLQRFVAEYEARHDKTKDLSASYVTLPEVTCYCTVVDGTSYKDVAVKAYLAHEKCVAEGYKMRGSEPLMAVYDGAGTCGELLASPYKGTLCIPVANDPAGDPNLRRFPSTEALSIIGFGSYDIIGELCKRLFEDIEKRDLTPSGPPRVISHVAPYAGQHFKTADYCTECVIPVKERKITKQ